MVAGAPAPLQSSIEAQFSAFDLSVFALKEDYHAVWQHRSFAIENAHRFAYVPRGADPEILVASKKPAAPVFAVDTPNTVDDTASEHFFRAIAEFEGRIS